MQKTNDQNTIIINADYEIFVLGLVLVSMVNNLFLFLPIKPDTRGIILIVDLGISIFLLLDFFSRLIRAKNKRVYLITRYGWLDFIGSLPITGLRVARLIRTLIDFRKLRSKDFKAMGNVVVEKRAESTLLSVLLLTVIVLELGGIAIINAENGAPGANIKTSSDALWWGYVTVTTIGYGDRYPVTTDGRLVGVMVMTVGVGLFSVITSYLADWFRRPRSPRRSERRLVSNGQDELSVNLQEIKRLIDAQELVNQQSGQALTELRSRLEALEKSLSEREKVE